MNEITKTGIFAGIALVLAGLAMFTETPTSTNVEDEARERVGDVLFPSFEDSLKVANLKIVKYDEKLGTHDQFEVAKDSKTGVWTLPSNDSYPADAQDQMSRAANSLIGVKILALASSRNDDQEMYGVVEPALDKTQIGTTGVGTLVRMLDDKGERLAEVIIGKKVTGSESQRYVRIPSNDQIYIAELDPANFPTDFNQWIDKDLLQLSSTDVRRLDIRKYDILIQGNQAGVAKDFEAVVDYKTEDGKWAPSRIVKTTQGAPTPRELTADEELNTTKLNAMKTALDSMQIAGVARKPTGLAANLKAEDSLLNDQAALQSLQSKGFFPYNGEILSSSGELLVSLKDGVRYLLRFGDTADTTIKSTEESQANTDAAFSINRYLLVTASLDESQIPEVGLEKVPQSIEEMEAIEAAAKPAESTSAQPNVPAEAGTTPPAPAEAASASETAAETPAPATPTESPAAETPAPTTETPAVETESTPASEPAAAEGTNETAPANTDSSKNVASNKVRLVAFQEEAQPAADEAKPAEQPESQAAPASGDSTPAAETAPAAESEPAAKTPAPADNEETAEEKQERLQALQEKITKSNQRKIDERNDRLEKAKARVAELNARFAEWYYVISESQYQKLSISYDELIQNKSAANAPQFNAPPAGAGGLPNFNFGN